MAKFIFTPTPDQELPLIDYESFRARMDHDFESSLYNIRTDLGVLLDFDLEKKERTKCLRSLMVSAKHIDLICSGLKQLADEQDPKEFDLRELILDLDNYFSAKLMDRPESLKSNLDINADSKIEIFGYEEVVYSLVYNFIANACDSYKTSVPTGCTEPPFPVEVYAKVVKLDDLSYLGHNQEFYTSEDDFIAISVTDKGCGIPEENLPKLFQQGFTTKDEDQKKHGIGVSIAEAVCYLVNGFIKVESELGKGSSFSLYLPKTINYTLSK
ncbi:HAMP domain-containing histidine kinase [Candidatus Woesearchaeota archaeon]|jgi:signal transduction histidine kinase|nr:HAMP domain-containing histidine kinase [Candidatus Woesearchaeota archaeon]